MPDSLSSQSRLKPGDEILTYCTRCKTDYYHLIIAMIDTQPKKVECIRCHSQHLFRKAPATKTAKSPAKTSKKNIPTAPVFALDPQRIAEAEMYQIRKLYAKGEYVRHPTFGIGVVTEVIDKNKITIQFVESARVLIHGKQV